MSSGGTAADPRTPEQIGRARPPRCLLAAALSLPPAGGPAAPGPAPHRLQPAAASAARSAPPPARAADGPLQLDGFNLIISLEVAISGGLLFRGPDGALRDLAGLSGSYRPVEETEAALQLLGRGLRALTVPAVRLLLDAPVANSGRLRARVLEHAAAWPCPVEVLLLPDVDRALVAEPRVVSSDSAVLDACTSWLNLGAWLITQYLPAARIIDLAAEPS